MFARHLAACCLVNLVVSLAWGASQETSASELVVYFSADPGQSPRATEYMRRELGQLMQTAGYDVVWRDAHASHPEQTASPVVIARLEGVCSYSAGDEPSGTSSRSAALAYTAVSDGHVLPFSTVNCPNLTRTLAAMLASEPGARRDFLYGRAVARVLAHEFYHILSGSMDHAPGGVAKSCFSTLDLVTERFAFEQATLARLRKHAPAIGEPSVADDAAGRW